MITLLIVEDSKRDMILYQKAIENRKDTELIFVESAEAALSVLKQRRIDAFFLDIELPGRNGFELAEDIRGLPEYLLTPILFITGYSKNPLGAFREFHCFDFIEKPFSMLQLRQILRDLIIRLQITKEKQKKRKRLIPLFTVAGVKYIPVDEILFAEVSRNRTTVQTDKETIPLSGMTLRDVIETVNSPDFLQCHKSFAVNINRIIEIEKMNYRLSKLTLDHSNVRIEMTVTYANIVKNRLDEKIIY